MEILVSVLGYIAVFGSAAVIAVVPAIAAYFISRKRLGKLWSYFAGVVLVLTLLASSSQKPLLLYSRECTQLLTQEQETSVRAVSAGVYSTRMPFVPLMVWMDVSEEDYAAWTQYYFPFGTQKMELSGTDGYNCTKNLFPW